jgi:hypothetical protein
MLMEQSGFYLAEKRKAASQLSANQMQATKS